MSVRRGVVVLAVAVAGAAIAAGFGLGAQPAGARSSEAHCTDRSTSCLKAVALTYVNALASDDPAMADKVRAAQSVQKWENGIHNAVGRSELVAGMKATQLLLVRIRDLRVFAARNGRDVFVMYLADGGAAGEPVFTSHVLERIGVRDGLIRQLEVVDCIGGPNDTSRPKGKALTTYDFGLCARGPR